jgi:pilus assembly protein Flp/PilA
MLKLYIAAQNKLASLKKFFSKKQEGASMVEYAILLGLITAAVITAIVTLGTSVLKVFTTVNSNFTG